MDPFVSVVVPVFNAGGALARLMHSLRAQTYPRERFEIIMVDNGSTDDSAQTIRSFGDEVRALSQTERRGPAATRNAGIRSARGEVLAFIDADCWAHPDWLAAGIRAMRTGGFDRVAGQVVFVLSPRPNIYEIYDSCLNFRQPDFVAQGWSGTGNLFVRRWTFERVGPFDDELISHEDSEWGLRATRAGMTLGYAPEAIVYHRARASLRALVRKWIRTEYGAAQVWRRHGMLELHLWSKKANYRPLFGTWRNLPPHIRDNRRIRFAFDAISNILRLAGNLGSFAGWLMTSRREAHSAADGNRR